MSETQQIPTAPPPGSPPPEGNRRGVLLVLTLAAVVALLAVLITVVRGGNVPEAQKGNDPTSSGSVDTNDPIHPEGRATLSPDDRSDDEAAVRYKWPMIHNDEFDGTSLDRTFWRPYSGKTTDNIGQHDPDNLSVSDGKFTITSHGYESGGMAWMPGQLYGRWEVRAKTEVGTGYGAVILLWPDAEDFPVGGEIDFMEIPKPERKELNFVLHYGKNNSQTGVAVPGDFTEWHNYAVEWTPDHVAGFIDGQEIFRTTDKSKLPPRKMHLAIQQDIGPFGKDWIPPLDETTPDKVQLQVDWVRIYGL